MQEERILNGRTIQLVEDEAISWWSWRPGIKPLTAFLLGGVLSLLALFLLVNCVTLLSGRLLDNGASPVRVRGVVVGHSVDPLGASQLVIHLEQPDFPATITLVVAPTTATLLTNGTPVIVDYAQHLRTPYALESGGRSYVLPGTGPTASLWETLALLCVGLLMLPYPALLFFWGWRDLRTWRVPQVTGYIVGRRAARQTTTRTPGLVPRVIRTWHGLAVQSDQEDAGDQAILTFGVAEDVYERFHRGERVLATYSPHLRHLYSLQHIEE